MVNKLINLSPFGELRFRFSMEYIFYLRISNLWKFFPIVFLKFHRSSAIGDSSNSDSFPFWIYNSRNIFPLSFTFVRERNAPTILEIILSRANFRYSTGNEYLRDIRFFAVTPITRVINRTALITRCDGGRKKKKKDRITRRWMENERNIDRRLSDDENRMGRLRGESRSRERKFEGIIKAEKKKKTKSEFWKNSKLSLKISF